MHDGPKFTDRLGLKNMMFVYENIAYKPIEVVMQAPDMKKATHSRIIHLDCNAKLPAKPDPESPDAVSALYGYLVGDNHRDEQVIYEGEIGQFQRSKHVGAWKTTLVNPLPINASHKRWNSIQVAIGEAMKRKQG